MADKIKAIKIKQKNGTYSEEIPISVNVQNVQWDENNHTLLDALGSVDISSFGKGNLQHQIDELDEDKISTNEFNSRLNNFLREQISADTTDWLDDNVNPVGSAVIVDKTLTIEGAAADAKAVRDELTAVKSQLTNSTEESPVDFFARDVFNLFKNGTNNSVKFTKGDGIVTANGTATDGTALCGFISPDMAVLPSWVVPGKALRIYVTTSDTNLRFCVAFYDSNGDRIGVVQYITAYKLISVPNGTVAIAMYLNVPKGATVTNATISIKIYKSIFDLQAMDELNTFSPINSDTDYRLNRLSIPGNVDGYVFIDPSDWEIGGFSYANNAITYGTNNKRIRTKQGFGYFVHAGDTVGLFDYTMLGFYVCIRKASDGIIYSNGYKTADYTVPYAGELYIVVFKQSNEVAINNVYDYLSLFFIRRTNSVISDVNKTTNTGNQFVFAHQYGTPVLIDDAETNNIIVCGKNLFRTPHGVTTHTHNSVTKTFNEAAGTITVTSTGATGAEVSPDIYNTVNGVSWNCLYKFKLPASMNVVVSPNADKDLYLYGDIYMQISDGVKSIFAYNEPVIFKAEANKEYGIRIYTKSSYADTVTFKPQIELNQTYPTEFEPFKGIVVDENGNVIHINTLSESLDGGVLIDSYRATVISYDDIVTVNYKKVTNYDHGFALYNLRNKTPEYKQPMITFIDDDTTNTTYVQNYHDVMDSLGVVGNYAAVTKQISESDALKTMLLNYEAEGFGVLLHCHYQSGDATDYFRPNPTDRDIDLVRENMVTGLRAMNGFGFIAKDYWVTPYGVNDPDIKALAKSLGLKAVISTLNNTPNVFGVTDRYSIGRYSFTADKTSINQNIPCIKRGMDACVANGGWIIVTTHANDWGDAVENVTDALSEIVTYANTIGMKVVNFQEGFETYF